MARFIAVRWGLGLGYAKTVVGAAFHAAEKYHLEPTTLLAIAARESSFRHRQDADPNNTYGIMQVIGRYHRDKFSGGVVHPTTVTENIEIGAKVVREYLTLEGGNEPRAIMRYNGSENKEDYQRSVTRLKKLFNRVAANPAYDIKEDA
ncbi:transglycosylase [Novimethylophilus kurashikiensis]|uniref:Transglycosylase n=1 Tax=Novimethylophilus kurashikiensis TaxID=1825523 RepID=A0A2R5FEL0_9PROT|nr:lytic transglycosylase domain-containing protein [Novimethylophilus kurashikiensis]GBG14874.1 transglycosylase [Novimethylophilus kurashikiensis]